MKRNNKGITEQLREIADGIENGEYETVSGSIDDGEDGFKKIVIAVTSKTKPKDNGEKMNKDERIKELENDCQRLAAELDYIGVSDEELMYPELYKKCLNNYEPIPLSIKEKRTMPIEMVKREEYEEIKAFYKDVYLLLGKMNFNPEAGNVNSIFEQAKRFVEKHQY